MARKDANGNWLNPKGNAYPVESINQVDIKRDEVVEKIVAQATDLQRKMLVSKATYQAQIERYMRWLSRRLKADETGKGNVTLTNYSGDQQVIVKVNDILVFDERLAIAKRKINKCIKKWSKGANRNLRIIVNNAFETDRAGNVNKNAILGLRKLKIGDKEWKSAMEIIADSLNITGTKSYLSIRTRRGSESKWQTVNLNFSTIEADESDAE